MKKSLIFLSIFIVALIAFVDAKDRIQELDEVAANTPSQVEMKQTINKFNKPMTHHTDVTGSDMHNNMQNEFKQMMQDNKLMQQQRDKVNKRRDTINNTVN